MAALQGLQGMLGDADSRMPRQRRESSQDAAEETNSMMLTGLMHQIVSKVCQHADFGPSILESTPTYPSTHTQNVLSNRK